MTLEHYIWGSLKNSKITNKKEQENEKNVA
jgi:hypothetical protein